MQRVYILKSPKHISFLPSQKRGCFTDVLTTKLLAPFLFFWFKQTSSYCKILFKKNNPHFQGLVIAGLGDLKRPAESLSIRQSASLAVTGLIWSRYSLIIKPLNYNLFAVNVFVALSSLYQLCRAYNYQLSQQNKEQDKKKPQ